MNQKEKVEILKNYEYQQLLCAIKTLRGADINLPYIKITMEISEAKKFSKEHFITFISEMHYQYRKMCEDMGLIKKGRMFWYTPGT